MVWLIAGSHGRRRVAAHVRSNSVKWLAVNRHWNGTPYRHPKGTPLIGES